MWSFSNKILPRPNASFLIILCVLPLWAKVTKISFYCNSVCNIQQFACHENLVLSTTFRTLQSEALPSAEFVPFIITHHKIIYVERILHLFFTREVVTFILWSSCNATEKRFTFVLFWGIIWFDLTRLIVEIPAGGELPVNGNPLLNWTTCSTIFLLCQGPAIAIKKKLFWEFFSWITFAIGWYSNVK